MQAQSAFAVAHIESVAQEFQSADIGTFGFLAVDLEFQRSLYELGDAFPWCALRLAGSCIK